MGSPGYIHGGRCRNFFERPYGDFGSTVPEGNARMGKGVLRAGTDQRLADNALFYPRRGDLPETAQVIMDIHP
jgi:hypothetical protein